VGKSPPRPHRGREGDLGRRELGKGHPHRRGKRQYWVKEGARWKIIFEGAA
jgi:hypothetical protein